MSTCEMNDSLMTSEEPTGHVARLREWCAELASLLEEQMVAKGLQGRTLTLKLKEDTFRRHERTCTLPTWYVPRVPPNCVPVACDHRMMTPLIAYRWHVITI
jgi:hypothetical protein